VAQLPELVETLASDGLETELSIFEFLASAVAGRGGCCRWNDWKRSSPPTALCAGHLSDPNCKQRAELGRSRKGLVLPAARKSGDEACDIIGDAKGEG
jgi:hypothetical protein